MDGAGELATDDRFAITQRLYAVSYANDTRDLDALLDVYTEDWIGHGFRFGEEEPFVVHRRDDLRRAFERFPPIRVLHHVSGVVFDELTPEAARTRSTALVSVQQSLETAPFVLNHAQYYDVWRKCPDSWRIASRRFVNWGLRALGDDFFPPS